MTGNFPKCPQWYTEGSFLNLSMLCRNNNTALNLRFFMEHEETLFTFQSWVCQKPRAPWKKDSDISYMYDSTQEATDKIEHVRWLGILYFQKKEKEQDLTYITVNYLRWKNLNTIETSWSNTLGKVSMRNSL